jgi:hypothetical protein
MLQWKNFLISAINYVIELYDSHKLKLKINIHSKTNEVIFYFNKS